MDTRYWGPSGWKLLHLISFAYNPERKDSMHDFLELLPYVLPCKFCRYSLSEYYEVLPFEDALSNEKDLSKWLWKIHGKVNNKLRGQGQIISPDPSYKSVRKIYLERLNYGCSKTEFPGWEFLFSIIENHPIYEKTSPMPDAPLSDTLKSDKELLKWNYLSPEKRYGYVCKFWSLLPDVLPFEEWRKLWLKHGKRCSSEMNKMKLFNTLWKVRSSIEKELDLLNKITYRKLCTDIRYHKSSCSNRKKTCRRIRKSRNKTKKLFIMRNK